MEPASTPHGISETLSPNGHAGKLQEDRAPGSPGAVRGASETVRTRPPGPSTRPALVVLGIALSVTVAGAVAAGLTGGAGSSSSAPVTPRTAAGSPLQAQSAAPDLRAITADGLPPQDVLDALTVPSGTTVVHGSSTDLGLGEYDRSIGLVVAAPEEKVIEFYRAELRAELWHVVGQGSLGVGQGYRIEAQHPASDGYEWELGVTVMPERFGDVGPAASASGAAEGSTPFTVRLFEVSDDQ